MCLYGLRFVENTKPSAHQCSLSLSRSHIYTYTHKHTHIQIHILAHLAMRIRNIADSIEWYIKIIIRHAHVYLYNAVMHADTVHMSSYDVLIYCFRKTSFQQVSTAECYLMFLNTFLKFTTIRIIICVLPYRGICVVFTLVELFIG